MRNKTNLEIQLIIMAKAPIAGLAKTRLIGAIGEQASANLAKSLFDRTLAEAQSANIGTIELCVTPAREAPVWATLNIPSNIVISDQTDGDLGERMQQAAQDSVAKGKAVLLIGTDCPSLDAGCLRQAAVALNQYDACIIPALDGGYVLLGLKQFLPEVFRDMPWSTSQVFKLTQQRIIASGKTLRIFDPLRDIDTAMDLQYLPPVLTTPTILQYLKSKPDEI